MASPTTIPRLVIDNSFGVLFLGVVVAAALWGVTAVQTWSYYNHYPKDLWYIKGLVAAVFVFDTIHQILIVHSMYWYLITNFSVPSELAKLVWSILLEVLFNALATLLVQGFLTYRVWLLSGKNMFITGILLLLVAAQFAGGIAFTVLSLELVKFKDLKSLEGLSISINVLAVIGDVMTAATLCIMLHRSRTGFRKSDTMISKLMVFTINTGLLTSVVAAISLITTLAFPNALIYAAFYFCIGRLYANSLLATLNARRVMSNTSEDPESLSISLRDMRSTLSKTASTGSKAVGMNTSRGPNISIQIDTTKEYVHDDMEGFSKENQPSV